MDFISWQSMSFERIGHFPCVLMTIRHNLILFFSVDLDNWPKTNISCGNIQCIACFFVIFSPWNCFIYWRPDCFFVIFAIYLEGKPLEKSMFIVQCLEILKKQKHRKDHKKITFYLNKLHLDCRHHPCTYYHNVSMVVFSRLHQTFVDPLTQQEVPIWKLYLIYRCTYIERTLFLHIHYCLVLLDRFPHFSPYIEFTISMISDSWSDI